MRLYAGTVANFVEETTQNHIADRLKTNYENYYGRRVGASEFNSWSNSLQFLKNACSGSVPGDGMIILEYELPYSTERIDCMLFGKGSDDEDNIVVMELKQWSDVKDCEIEENVITFVGGAQRMVPHPAMQVRGYHFYLKDFIDVFHATNSPDLSSCVYCHNYKKTDSSILFNQKFKEVLSKFPVFTKDDYEELANYLKARLSKGQGTELFNRFSNSNVKPSKKLVEVASNMIEGQQVFNLLDEQITANNTIIDRAKKAATLDKKTVVIVKGGPGTGKSVIALNALSELLKSGMTVYHATGSRAFTSTLRKIVGARASKLFKYFNSFTKHRENEIDVLICDEAHRIRKSSNSRYTKIEFRSEIPQIDELIKASKVSIFFIDDHQVVRPEEVGHSDMIREAANKYNTDKYEFELKTQFRCNGSEGFLNWIDDVLGIKQTANRELTENERMDFKIFDSPEKLYEAIKEKNNEKPNSARLVAGFCWPWSDPNPDGTIIDDVVIGDFKMPWEGKDGKKLAPEIPPASIWAYDPRGVNQVGSIYTIQGFEFEYVGIIFGKDLVYDLENKKWVGIPENSADQMIKRGNPAEFVNYVKNVYRVLLTRGMKGCYVYFMDKNTENYFRTKINFRK